MADRQIQLTPENLEYLEELKKEKETEGFSDQFPHSVNLINKEIERIERNERKDGLIDLLSRRQHRVIAKIAIPEDNARVNYVGRLLGPKGATLRQIQEETQAKMFIFGKGSMRDEAKEKDLLEGGEPMYRHLNEPLHVKIEALSSPAESFRRVAFGMNEVRKMMLPENEQFIKMDQMSSMGLPLYSPRGGRGAPRGRGGGPMRGRGGGMGGASLGRGGGMSRGRGFGGGRGGMPRGRGGSAAGGGGGYGSGGRSSDYGGASAASAGGSTDYTSDYSATGSGYGASDSYSGGSAMSGRGRGTGERQTRFTPY